MAKQFKVGDRVLMNKAGVKQVGNQSNSTAGTIEDAAAAGWFWVEWDGGNGNNYKTEHLKKVKVEVDLIDEIYYKDEGDDVLEVDTESTQEVFFRIGEGEDDNFEVAE